MVCTKKCVAYLRLVLDALCKLGVGDGGCYLVALSVVVFPFVFKVLSVLYIMHRFFVLVVANIIYKK